MNSYALQEVCSASQESRCTGGNRHRAQRWRRKGTGGRGGGGAKTAAGAQIARCSRRQARRGAAPALPTRAPAPAPPPLARQGMREGAVLAPEAAAGAPAVAVPARRLEERPAQPGGRREWTQLHRVRCPRAPHLTAQLAVEEEVEGLRGSGAGGGGSMGRRLGTRGHVLGTRHGTPAHAHAAATARICHGCQGSLGRPRPRPPVRACWQAARRGEASPPPAASGVRAAGGQRGTAVGRREGRSVVLQLGGGTTPHRAGHCSG